MWEIWAGYETLRIVMPINDQSSGRFLNMRSFPQNAPTLNHIFYVLYIHVESDNDR
jgi:hypothetical protein